MRVLMAKTYGFCPGVRRAITMARNSTLHFDKKLAQCKHTQHSKLFVLKQIVHNPQVVANLGIKSVKNLRNIPDGATIIFSAHGVAPAVFAQAKKKNLTIIDATCPLVTRVHHLAQKLVKDGYEIIYLGDPGHDEVIGVVGEAPKKIHTIREKEEIKDLKISQPEKLVVLTQTTLAQSQVLEIIRTLKERFPDILVKNTICHATSQRQQAVADLAKKVKTMIVIGGKNSANTKRLGEVAEENGVKAYQIEEEEELVKIPLEKIRKVGVTAGASTPDWVIQEVVKKLANL